MEKHEPEKDSEIVSLLKRNNDLLTVLAKVQLSDVLETELADPKYRKLYELTGKNVPIKRIASKIKMATGVISQTWQHWEQKGIVVKDGKSYRRVFP